MRRILITITCIVMVILFGWPLTAGQKGHPVPLLLSGDIKSAVNPSVFQGVQGSEAGVVYFPDKILAVKITPTAETESVINQWSKYHVFYIVPFSISVSPSKGFIPKEVDITAAFGRVGQVTNQPLIIDIFPETGFKKGAITAEGEVKLGADLTFSKAVPAEATAKMGMTFSYSPAYANVVSGYASGHAFWQFKRSQDYYPIGNIPLKLIVAVPRTVAKTDFRLTFDVRTEFEGSWWSNGRAIVAFKSRVMLPPS